MVLFHSQFKITFLRSFLKRNSITLSKSNYFLLLSLLCWLSCFLDKQCENFWTDCWCSKCNDRNKNIFICVCRHNALERWAWSIDDDDNMNTKLARASWALTLLLYSTCCHVSTRCTFPTLLFDKGDNKVECLRSMFPMSHFS